jgi:hypothetical protein
MKSEDSESGAYLPNKGWKVVVTHNYWKDLLSEAELVPHQEGTSSVRPPYHRRESGLLKFTLDHSQTYCQD